MRHDNHLGKLSQNYTMVDQPVLSRCATFQASCMVDDEVRFNFLHTPNYHTFGLFWKPISYQMLLHSQVPSPSTSVPPSMMHIAAVLAIWACFLGWYSVYTKATMSPTPRAKFPVILIMTQMAHYKNGGSDPCVTTVLCNRKGRTGSELAVCMFDY